MILNGGLDDRRLAESSVSNTSAMFHSRMLSVEALHQVSLCFALNSGATHVATCLPSGRAARQLIGPDSIGVRNVRSNRGAAEPADEDDTLRRTSHTSMVPFRLPANT